MQGLAHLDLRLLPLIMADDCGDVVLARDRVAAQVEGFTHRLFEVQVQFLFRYYSVTDAIGKPHKLKLSPTACLRFRVSGFGCRVQDVGFS